VSESPIPVDEASPDLLRAGREALVRHAWTDAFELLSQADAGRPLSGADLELLAEAAFFAAQGDARIEIKERAFKAYLDEGNPVRAAFHALDVAFEHMVRGRVSIASAWARRAEPLLDGVGETYAHAYLALVQSDMAKARGDLPAAIQRAEEAVEIAKRTGHADLTAMALTTIGTLKVGSGSATDGIALLEEAAIAAISGELSPITAGMTSCQMIAACRDLTDYQRANEWLEATDRWCERQEVSGFPGICRVHRAEIVALQGGWDRAEEELRRATTELKAYSAVPPMADGLYAIGEIRRLKGDVAGAEEALREAHALGRSPQPAMALLRLGAGQVQSAMATIDAALREPMWDQWARGRLLAAQVEIAVAAGDVQRARGAADELGRIVEGYDSPALKAGTQEANGRVLLAEGDAGGAITELRTAMQLWRKVGAAHEIARVRLVLARALRSAGDEDDAELELRAARDEFARLGAKPDLDATERELRLATERRGATEQVRRTFLFTDIVGSTKLAEALGNDPWERLLRWHDDTLRTQFARSGGVLVNSTGDGFFVAFETTAPAVACAIEIQRALAEHRTSTGYAPPVRIGIHTADAVVRGSDYSGVGVHVAARLAGLADGGEILISQEALSEAGGVRTSEPRDVTVKGFSRPMTVAGIAWRSR
jgi:class 3 adenylate cyclase